MTKGREKSDDRVVPESRRKTVLTAKRQGGKAVTASEQTRQLRMNLGTAESPKGDALVTEAGQPSSSSSAVPKPRGRKRGVAPAMTMEEVANEGRLREAFEQVKSNDGAPGPDGQSVEEVARHLHDILPVLIGELLEETYQPGAIRRVWIPKAAGGASGDAAALPADVPSEQPWLSGREELSYGHSRSNKVSGRRLRVGGGHRSGEVLRSGSSRALASAAGAEGERSPAATANPTDAEGQGGDAGWSGGQHGRRNAARWTALAAAEQHRARRAR